MKCPVDGAILQMTARQDVEIDYCPQCRGIWLDRGELDKLIERDRSGHERYDDDDDDYDDRRRDRDRDRDRMPLGDRDRDRDGRKHRKRGWLSEIFEFGE